VLFPEVDAKPVAGKATAAQNVEPLRFHDLRATFVTWAKRAGKGDGWISDRTGHLTPEMIDRYSRAARTLADLKMEPFPELKGTIPEFCDDATDRGGGGGETPREGENSAAGELATTASTAAAEPTNQPPDSRAGAGSNVDPAMDPRGLSGRQPSGSIPQKQGKTRRLATSKRAFRFQWGNSRGGSSPPLRIRCFRWGRKRPQPPRGGSPLPARAQGPSPEVAWACGGPSTVGSGGGDWQGSLRGRGLRIRARRSFVG
jgi:hypothetical protein